MNKPLSEHASPYREFRGDSFHEESDARDGWLYASQDRVMSRLAFWRNIAILTELLLLLCYVAPLLSQWVGLSLFTAEGETANGTIYLWFELALLLLIGWRVLSVAFFSDALGFRFAWTLVFVILAFIPKVGGLVVGILFFLSIRKMHAAGYAVTPFGVKTKQRATESNQAEDPDHYRKVVLWYKMTFRFVMLEILLWVLWFLFILWKPGLFDSEGLPINPTFVMVMGILRMCVLLGKLLSVAMIADALGYRYYWAAIFAILMIFNVIDLIVLVFLISQAAKQLRDAGYQVGFFSVKRPVGFKMV